MYPAWNYQNVLIIFSVTKRDQSDKRRLVTDCHLRYLAIDKKQTLLTNMDELIELVTTYSVETKIDLADVCFNMKVKEGSKTCNTIQTTRGKIRS